MAILSLLLTTVSQPKGIPWERLILNVFDFVANYGWRIVLFTLILKLVLYPLDLYQRLMMRKNQKITERMKPQLEKLQKQYGHDKTLFSQKQMELNKKEGYSYFSSCLPMILTMVIFFWLFSSLNTISQYMNMRQYVELYDQYKTTEAARYTELGYDELRIINTEPMVEELNALNNKGEENLTEEEKARKAELDTAIADANAKNEAALAKQTIYLAEEKERRIAAVNADGALSPEEKAVLIEEISHLEIDGLMQEMVADAMSKAQDAVYEFYYDKEAGNQESFLWIKNIWAADVPWKKPILEFDAFKTAVSKFGKASKSGISQDVLSDLMSSTTYNNVTYRLRVNNPLNKVNGYLILPILAVGMSLLSQFISSRQQKKAGQMNATGGMGGGMKMMMILMPVMMGFFSLMYTSAFALYMVLNSGITVLLNLLTSGIIALVDRRGPGKVKSKDGAIVYGRPDPKTLSAGKGKKGKDKNADTVYKYGRPDPQDLKKEKEDPKKR